MFSNLESIISVHINHVFGNNCDLSYMLSNCINLKNFTYDTYCNSSHLITDTIGMFYNCISLNSFSFYNLYMSSPNTYKRNMSYMFYNCQMLNSISDSTDDVFVQTTRLRPGEALFQTHLSHEYHIDNDGNPDNFITDPNHGGPGWDTDGDGEVDIPVVPDTDGNYPPQPTTDEGLGNATNGLPNLKSPGIELGTSVNLEWQEGLILTPSI